MKTLYQKHLMNGMAILLKHNLLLNSIQWIHVNLLLFRKTFRDLQH